MPAWLIAGLLLANACQDASSPTSGMRADADGISLAATDGANTSLQEVTVFTSGSHVTAWDPILPSAAYSNWESTICVAQPLVGLNDSRWTNPHNAFQFSARHPFEDWFPSWDFDAEWINAYTNGPWPGWASLGPNGHNWTKYSTPVSGNGDFVVQFLADNCSWIYLDGELVGFQDGSFATNASGRYGVRLDGEHELSFIIFDGGGAAGGKFRLETTQSFIDNGGDTGVVVPPSNTAPVADAGSDASTEATGATTSVTLDGSGSSDANGDNLTYTWSKDGFTVATGATPTLSLGLGSHTFTLTVDDGKGASDTDDVTVTITDTTAPTISFSIVTQALWPPNHKMVLVGRGISASDVVDADADLNITVTSNELANGLGDGNTSLDHQIVTNADGSFDVYVRAERSGKGSGRVYTISMSATDASGNTSSRSFTATVAQNQSRASR